MAQQLTLRRVGGMLPTLRPSKTWVLDMLYPGACQVTLALVARAGCAPVDAFADAPSDQFEFDGRTVSVPFADMPAELHASLPCAGPAMRRVSPPATRWCT